MRGVNKHLDALIEFLRIPSVSANPDHKEDVARAARWLEAKLSALGFQVEVVATPGHPIVYAERIVDPQAPTVLIYGHYDVQPPDPLELWHTPPFEPTLQEGKLYARGASDDKGQIYAHIAAVEDLGPDLGVNVKFVIEGEEEISSAHLEPFVRSNAERLGADVLLISDGAMYAPGVPSLEYGLRGLVYMEVRLEGANRDLHSGVYGGAAPNPIHAAAWMIAKLKGEDGRILVPGFYDAVRELTEEERANLASLNFDAAAFASSIGAEALPGEPGWGALERTWVRPTLDVNGIWGGYQGEGSKTVIPAKAGFKFSMRLVPDQDPEAIQKAVTEYLQRIKPEGYRMEILYHGTGKPVVTELDSPYMRKAAQALEAAWGRKPVFTRSGGSIPIVANFQELLGIPVVLLGMGLNDDNLHSPNEKFDLVNYEKGIEASRNFLRLMSAP
ncbi:MAG: dipeptidase [Meiothermus silvanus]|nr:dipeptidase [Allomeiothermus silvanus]